MFYKPTWNIRCVFYVVSLHEDHELCIYIGVDGQFWLLRDVAWNASNGYGVLTSFFWDYKIPS